jgi:Domain of unknown function (DUF4153)
MSAPGSSPPPPAPSVAPVADRPIVSFGPLPSGYSSFGPQWPGPSGKAGTDVLIAVGLTALVAAAAVPWDRPGVGWFVTGLVGAITVAVAARRHREAEPPRTTGARLMQVVWALLALALLAAGALRAAPWLWLLCLPTAVICGALALAGGRSVRALVLAVLSVPIAMVRGMPWFTRGLAMARGRARWSPGRILATLSVTIMLVLVFGALLAGADAVFADVLDTILPTVDGGVIARWVFTFMVFGIGTVGACYVAVRPPAFGDGAAPSRGLGRFEWGVPVGGLVLLFGGFVAVQATVLFGGARHVLDTAGLTSAEYARQGFWQLLAVTVLTLLVIGVVVGFARRDAVADRTWLRVLLGALSVLSLVIVASALSRMWAYTDAYGLTQLRLLVALCEGWFGLVFLMLLVAGVRLRAPWLPQVVVATAAATLVGLVAVNPDLLIAQQNLARTEAVVPLDLGYLAELSVDAVPALEQLPLRERRCVLLVMKNDLDALGQDELREWNLGRARARPVLEALPPIDVLSGPHCDVLFRR